MTNSNGALLNDSDKRVFDSLTPEDRLALIEDLEELKRRQDTKRYEASLIDFVEAAWPYIDPSKFQRHWVLEALCEHLEAVTHGKVRRLLANYPPRAAKTNICSICWPAWTWIQRNRSHTSGPQVRFLTGSYGFELSLTNSNKMRRLINSPFFQERWGDLVVFREDQNTKSQFDNTAGGSRQTSSVGGSLVGLGGDIIIVDDPHNTEEVESDPEREKAINWWKELSTTRLNNAMESAIVVIMQRLHELDVSGFILNGEDAALWCHLMIPMRHDGARHCVTSIGWEDPRQDEDILWKERWPLAWVESLERNLGPYMASGRLQQMPSPKGGGIVKDEWWQVWPPIGYEGYEGQGSPEIGKPGDDDYKPASPDYRPWRFPQFSFILCSVDTAYTEKEENDWCACTVWGLWTDRARNPRIMLLEAWKEHYELHELVQRIMNTCRRKGREVDICLIESKASGLSTIQEIKRLMRDGEWHTIGVDPEGDKVARMHAVVPLFSGGMVYAPFRNGYPFRYAQMVINDVSAFPKGQSRDIADTVSMALRWLRRKGLARFPDELEQERMDDLKRMVPGGHENRSLHYDI